MCESNMWLEFGAKRTTHKNILIKYHEHLLAKSIEFIITNMKKVWSQAIAVNELNKICEISGEVDTLIENLVKAVKSEDSELNFVEPDSTDDTSTEPNFELIGYFGGLATSFKFHVKEIPEGVYKHITLPLLLLLQHAEEEKSFLVKQLKAKDDEIQEWRATNATITRGLLKTELFSELETKVPMVVPTDITQKSAQFLCSIPGYKNICKQMTQLSMFDVVVKTEIDSAPPSELDTQPGPSVQSTDVKEETSSTSQSTQNKPTVVPHTKVKQEKRPRILTAPSQGQAGKKTKAKKMLI